MRALSHSLHASHPLALLDAVSGLMAATEPRRSMRGKEEPAVGLGELVDTFVGTDLAATTAALHVIAALTEDEVLAARIRHELAARQHRMPAWLRGLETTRVAEVFEMRHVLRDGEQYSLDVRLPDRFSLSALIYVDNNLGQVVKDGFVADVLLHTMLEPFRADLDEDSVLEPIDPAVARARLEEALFVESIMVPPMESDTWPLCRPLVRWLVRCLPEGGVLPERTEWTDETLDEIAKAFLASRFGSAYGDEEHRGLLRNLLWLGAEYDIGDPLRWSPVNVELLLVDRVPRKVIEEAGVLTKLPALLRSFVRYAHTERSLRLRPDRRDAGRRRPVGAGVPAADPHRPSPGRRGTGADAARCRRDRRRVGRR